MRLIVKQAAALLAMIHLLVVDSSAAQAGVPVSLPIQRFGMDGGVELRALSQGDLFLGRSNPVRLIHQRLEGGALSDPSTLTLPINSNYKAGPYGILQFDSSTPKCFRLYTAPPVQEILNWPSVHFLDVDGVKVGEHWVVYPEQWTDSESALWPTGVNRQGTYLSVVNRTTGSQSWIPLGTVSSPWQNVRKTAVDGDKAAVFLDGSREVRLFDLNAGSLLASAGSIPIGASIEALCGETVVMSGDPQYLTSLEGRLIFIPMSHPEERMEVLPPALTGPASRSYSKTGAIATDGGVWAFYTRFDSESQVVRHFTLGANGLPSLDFIGRLPKTSGPLSDTDNYAYQWVADGERAVLYSPVEGLVVFDRAHDLPVLAMDGAAGRESDGSMTMTATLDRVATQEVTFRVRSEDGSARSGVDYVAVDQMVTIPAGADRVSWQISIQSDLQAELNESFFLRISELSGAVTTVVGVPAVIQEVGLRAFDNIQFKSLPSGKSVDMKVAASPNGILGYQGHPARLLAFGPDGSYLSTISEYVRPDSRFIQMGDGRWASLGLTLDGSEFEVTRFDPSTGAMLGRTRLSSFGMGLNASIFLLKSGKVLGWSQGANAVLIDPVTGASETLPLALNGPSPSKVYFAEGATRIVVACVFSGFKGDGSYESSNQLLCFDSNSLALRLQMGSGNPSIQGLECGGLFATGESAFMVGPNVSINLQSGAVQWSQRQQLLPLAPFMPMGKVVGVAEGCFVVDRPSYQIGVNSGVELVDAVLGLRVASHESKSDRAASYYPATVNNGFVILRQFGDEGEGQKLLLFARSVPDLVASISSCLPGHGAVMTVGWSTAYSRGANVVWNIHAPAASKLPREFLQTSGTVRINGEGKVDVLIPMRVARADLPPAPFLEITLSTPDAGDPPDLVECRSKVLRGFSDARQMETVRPSLSSGEFRNYDTIRASDRWVVCHSSRYHPEIQLYVGQLEVFDAATGVFIRSIIPPISAENQLFGMSLLIHGDLLLVGCPNYRSNRLETAGSVSVYRLETGEKVVTLGNSTKVAGFGEVIASGTNYFAVGSPPDSGAKQGYAVYRWSDFKRTATSSSRGEGLGNSLVFSGDRLFIGAPYTTLKSGRTKVFNAGKVYVVEPGAKRAAPWGQQGPALQNGLFGNSMEASQGLVFIRSRRVSPSVGFVDSSFVFEAQTGNLKKVYTVEDPGPYPYGIAQVDSSLSLVRSNLIHFSDLRSGTMTGGLRLVARDEFTHRDQCLTPDHLYWTDYDGIYRCPIRNQGDFTMWSRLNLGPAAAGDPLADVNGNQSDDFDDYLSAVLEPGAALVETEYSADGASWHFKSKQLIPCDCVAILETRSAGGSWMPEAFRDGRDGWREKDGTAWQGDGSPEKPLAERPIPEARVTLLPHPSLAY